MLTGNETTFFCTTLVLHHTNEDHIEDEVAFRVRCYKLQVPYDGQRDLELVRDESRSMLAAHILSSRVYSRYMFKTIFAHIGVPRDLLRSLLDDLFKAVESAIPEQPNYLFTSRAPESYNYQTSLESASNQIIETDSIQREESLVMMESIETYSSSMIPATKSSIEALEKVKLESLSPESSSTCAVCFEEFSQGVDGGDQQMIARMPCNHHYHLHCIVPWLETNHLCPLCRYAMPTLE